MENSLKDWKVVDLLIMCDEIANGDRKHPVYKERQSFIEDRCRGNDSAVLIRVGDDESTPLINDYMVNDLGLAEGSRALLWVSW